MLFTCAVTPDVITVGVPVVLLKAIPKIKEAVFIATLDTVPEKNGVASVVPKPVAVAALCITAIPQV